MADRKIAALSTLMDRFGQEHWNDTFAEDRARLSIEGDVLRCEHGGEVVEGHATAPLLFVSGAWALIFSHESDGKYGHRVAGRINRVWPNGINREIDDHRFGEAITDFAALWPDAMFSSSLYRDLQTPGHPRRPKILESGPSRTTLTGILKHVVTAAGDADPLERMRVAEFIDNAVRREWSNSAEDAMLAVVGKPLLKLARDAEPATRELALLALETCAEACWRARAYGVYEPLCEALIEAGLNSHFQHVRLAESAYASGDIARGDALFAIAIEGQNINRALKLGSAYDAKGDWSDMQTLILRQAGGSHRAFSVGHEPNIPRQAKKEKKGITPPDAATAAHHRALARELLARAAEGAERRIAIDLSAIESGTTVPLGTGEIDPKQRRLRLTDIFMLQAHLAHDEGDTQTWLRLMFKAMETDWRYNERNPLWRAGYEETVLKVAADCDDATLASLGMPGYLAPLVSEWRTERDMAGSDDGREQLFWRTFMLTLRDRFHEKRDFDYKTLPGNDLVPEMRFEREGATLVISHPALGEPERGPLSALFLTGMRAWHRILKATYGDGAWYGASHWQDAHFPVADIPILARIARETLEAGAKDEAIALYRFAHGSDPLVRPFSHPDPVVPLPIEEVPEELRDAVARRSPLEVDGGHAKLRPRGRRVEALAKDYDATDVVSARYIGHALREATNASDSDIDRVLKSAPALLMSLWNHPDPQVREIAVPSIFCLRDKQSFYSSDVEMGDIIAAAEEAGIADLAPKTRERNMARLR